jgi:thiosulfate dehydrogenase [quinone] large subunit
MKKGDKFLAATRISLGLIFLWAFFDKLFGLGFATAKEAAVINGGSPTLGFLQFGTKGPLAGIFKAMAGSLTVDILFMAGLFFIGLFLILGIMKKTITILGTILMVLMWAATLLPEHNPFLDEHIIYGLILLYLGTQEWKFSLEKEWLKLKLVKKYNFLS